jgi:DNA primase
MTHHPAAATLNLPDLQRLKQQIPLLDYLRRNHWEARRSGTQAEFVGLCPLPRHRDTRPSFYVNTRKNLFYCHGCDRGGDLIRFVELSQGLGFSQAVSYLLQQIAPDPQLTAVLNKAASFYRLQLHRHPEAVQYLAQRGLRDAALIEELAIGYAPGGNLPAHLAGEGYSFQDLLHCGLINSQGHDAFCRRIIFPCRQQGHIVNLYGRSIGAAFPHRFLPHSKGGLFAWDSLRHCSTLILVEGLFDLAILWQAGFRNTTSAMGTHLTSTHLDQLCQTPRRVVYIAFDQDDNRAGQQVARQLAQRLERVGVAAPLVRLPHGHDPNSYFLIGAKPADFAACLQSAQRL